MSSISVDVVKDSKFGNNRLTTLSICIPRIILSEFNTHRVFSRNARSTRAVPTTTLINEVRTNPFVPSRFYRNKPGMQGTELVVGDELLEWQNDWRQSALEAADRAELHFAKGMHKQHAGRVLEPFTWSFVCVTATEWDNFLELRDNPQAQPEMEDLAKLIRHSLATSIPDIVGKDYWHLPWIREDEHLFLEDALCVSVARCARVSYKSFDNKEFSLDSDKKLAQTLLENKHFSPFEHQAVAMHPKSMRSNFTGWTQYRQIV